MRADLQDAPPGVTGRIGRACAISVPLTELAEWTAWFLRRAACGGSSVRGHDRWGWALSLAGLVVPLVGVVEATGEPFEPYRLVDPAGEPVLPVSAFLADLQACGRSGATQRSYSMALLRWFRFLWAVEVPWDQATHVEARDFVRWVQVPASRSAATGG